MSWPQVVDDALQAVVCLGLVAAVVVWAWLMLRD